VTLDPRRSANALAASAPELARAWRGARGAARPSCFPGLLDGLVEPLVALAAEALGDGRDPATPWAGAVGIVRVDAHDRRRTLAELDAEWDVMEQVLRAACDALGAGEDVRGWISRALVIARAGSWTLLAGGGPRGILAVKVFSDLGATRRARAAGPR
jgi:hypothetical protein